MANDMLMLFVKIHCSLEWQSWYLNNIYFLSILRIWEKAPEGFLFFLHRLWGKWGQFLDSTIGSAKTIKQVSQKVKRRRRREKRYWPNRPSENPKTAVPPPVFFFSFSFLCAGLADGKARRPAVEKTLWQAWNQSTIWWCYRVTKPLRRFYWFQ